MVERLFPKWLVGLVITGLVVFTTFVVLAVLSFSEPSSGENVYPQSLLERDRVMTERMAVQSMMGEDGMLERSQDPEYVRALEEHTRQFDRMLGRTP